MITFSFANKSYQTGRVIGRLVGDSGPTIIFVGGIHGNERSGVIALQQVFSELEQANVQPRGEMLSLVGNMAALAQNKRFLSQDLNRIWDRDFSQQFPLREAHTAQQAVDEAHEQIELYRIMKPYMQRAGQCIFIDLHTTSAASVPFIVINDQVANRRFAQNFTIPTVLGIEEYLSGPLLSYLNDLGHVALAFEAGQHDDPESVHTHVAFIYLALLTAGALEASQIPRFDHHRSRLLELGRENHDFFEVTYRRTISSEDQFVMKPGYENFSPISKAEILASDRGGEIRAERSGRVFMPLYQSIGSDGFFIVRRIPMWALRLSTVLRKVNFERLLVWLPGVIRCSEHPDAIMVQKKIAKFLSIELFHLLGYRRKKDDCDAMIFVRREVE